MKDIKAKRKKERINGETRKGQFKKGKERNVNKEMKRGNRWEEGRKQKVRQKRWSKEGRKQKGRQRKTKNGKKIMHKRRKGKEEK